MKNITEQLPFRTANYPQLTRLPKGVRLVKQKGFKKVQYLKKYCAFTANGTLISINLGNNIKNAKRAALSVLNKKLREANMIHGNPCPSYYYTNEIQ